jgi:hypothetical protein
MIHTWNSKAPTRSYLAQLPTLLLPLLSIPQSACNVIPTNLTPGGSTSLSIFSHLLDDLSFISSNTKNNPSSLLLFVLVAVHCVAAFLVVPGQPRPALPPPPTRNPTLQPNNNRACQQSTRAISLLSSFTSTNIESSINISSIESEPFIELKGGQLLDPLLS